MRKPKPLPSQETLRELLDYDPATGFLTWKYRSAKWRRANSFNAQFAGERAFTARTAGGYYTGAIQDKLFLSHRVIWKWAHGIEPLHIDHIDGDPGNNQLENLRSVSHSENLKNSRLRSDNKTGVCGVKFIEETGRFRAILRQNGRSIHIGCFGTLDEAATARLEASGKYGFHPNHGRAA